MGRRFHYPNISIITLAGMLAAAALAFAEEGAAHKKKEAGGSVLLPEVVISATRSEEQRADMPQSTDIITSIKLEDSTGFFLTDRIKKNSSLDVIDFGGGLANIGMRGFSPDLHGINPRVLTLIDGRPAGPADSFGSLTRNSVERIEVLKGPASSLYGPSAMSGVVNIITKKSSGTPSSSLQMGGGSFGTVETHASSGGSLTTFADFDFSASFLDQRDSFRTPHGQLPNTDFEIYSGRMRLGFDLGRRFRLDFSSDIYQGNRIGTHSGESFGEEGRGQRNNDNVGGDVTLIGDLGKHLFRFKWYGLRHETESFRSRTEGSGFFLGFNSDVRYTGVQAQNEWTPVDRFKLIYGVDSNQITSESGAFLENGTRRGPFSPIHERETTGVFIETLSRFFEERLILTIGGRFDSIDTATKQTPFRPDLTPGSASFTEFNPRGGIVYKFSPVWRLHSTVGRGFIAPDGADLAGFVDQTTGGRRTIARGNPDLSPESSISGDFGVGYTRDRFDADLTYFHTKVKNRITTRTVTDTPTLRETLRVNAVDADISGLEAAWTLGPAPLAKLPGMWALSGGLTWTIEADEELPAPTGRTPLLNVSKIKSNMGLTWSRDSQFNLHLNARYRGERPVRDFSKGLMFTGGKGGIYDQPSFLVVDIVARYAVTQRSALELAIDNLFNKYYVESADFPRPGTAVYARYKVTL
ncbi:MAG: TonB-dependent receptor [Candidatus Manganitrophaceae bacterium]